MQEETHQSDDPDAMVVEEVSNVVVCISPQCGLCQSQAGMMFLNHEWDSQFFTVWKIVNVENFDHE